MESKDVAIKLLDVIEKCIDESANSLKWGAENRLCFAKMAEHLAGAYSRLTWKEK